jgi:WD40 repeat protein
MKNCFSLLLLLFLANTLPAQKPQLIPPMSHAAYVRALACSPDGKYVLTCAGYLDNTVLLWSTEGRLLKIMDGHHNDLLDAEFSADGKYMLTLETNTWALHLWDNEGNELRVLSEGMADVASCLQDACFAPDNQHILAGDCGGNLHLYDFAGKLVQEFKGGEAPIREVAFSRSGQYLASCDDAGIIRVYQNDGTLVHVLDGHEQKPVLSLEFTPDEQYFVSGGEDKMAVLWSMTDGEVKRMGPHTTIVRSVAISPDGKYIATAGPDDLVTKLWDARGNLIRNLELRWANEIIFTPDSRSLLVGPLDKGALLYDLEGKLLRTYTNSASPVTSVGFSPFSPDSLFLVTGGEGKHLRLWDAVTGDAAPLTANPGALPGEGAISAPVAFYPNDPVLLIGHAGDSLYLLDLYSFEEYAYDKPAFSSTSAIAWGGDHFLTSDFNGNVQCWRGNENGELILEWDKKIPANYVTSLEVAPDGVHFLSAISRDWIPSVAHFKTEGPEQPYDNAGLPATLRRVDNFAVVRSYGKTSNLAIISSDGKYVATNEGEEHGISLFQYENAREIFHVSLGQVRVMSLAFSSDGRAIAAGCSDNIAREYDLKGNLIREYKGHLSAVRAVAYSPFGEYLLTGSSDNTAKLWDTETGKEIVSLMAVGTEDWLVITPDGLFDASEGAMNLLYFTAGLEVVELEQLKDRYYEPGLFAKVMGFDGGNLRAVEDLDNLENALPPVLNEAVLDGDKIRVRLEKRSGGIGDAVLLLDGDIEIIPDANPRRLESFEIDLSPYAGYFVAGQPNRLSIVLYNAEGWLPSQPYPVAYTPDGAKEKGDANKPKPTKPTSLSDKSDLALSNTLYALVIGTADYAGTELDLRFPDKDAIAYKEVLELSGAALFGARMNIKLLTTAAGGTKPTKAAIQAALTEFAAKAEPKDILLVYLSGHGTTWPENSATGQFYYLTADNSSFNFEDAKNRSFAIPQDSLQSWIRGVKARKRILILDACNSGEVVKQLESGAKGSLNSDQRRALERMKDRGGFFVLAGSAADKSSYEDPRFGHGLLTYSLLRNMPKIAALDKNRYVDVGKLFTEVREDVPKLASELKKVQEPKLIGMEDFSIGQIKDGTALKLPTAKKIITKSSFSNKKRTDPLKLTDAINEQLEQMLAAPTLPFAFWPVDKAAGLYYTLNGEYEVTGATVKVTAYFYQSDQENELKSFSVSGASNQVKNLVDELMGQFGEYLEGMK